MQKNKNVQDRKPIEIVSKNLIICEGADALYFLLSILQSTEHKELLEKKEGIQIINFGGNSELKTTLKLLKAKDNFNIVESILIIRDAESNYNVAISEIKSALRENSFLIPENVCEKAIKDNEIAIGYLLFPTCSSELENGTLEDLCLKIINEDNKEKVGNIVGDFLDNMKKEKYTELKQYHKNLLHSYLSAKDGFVTLKLGEAARAGAFDFNSEKLKPLLEFINVMLEK